MAPSDMIAASSNPMASDATNRRRSGRAKQQPVLFQEDPSIPQSSLRDGKRKRTIQHGGDASDQAASSDEEDSPDEESDPDEEELKERRRGAPKAKKPPAKPPAKKVKTNGATTKLAVRPATNGFKKPAPPKKSRVRPNAAVMQEESGLYAEVFSNVHTMDAVAADWIARYQQHNANAMCELINFVLRCTGCKLQLDVHDIEDPDNAPSRLEDLMNEFHAQKIAEYPLVSKAKAHANFRTTITSFFHALIFTAYAAGILYNEPVFIENIEVWVIPMSDSTIRPFRHTATVIALQIGTTICGLIAEIADNTAKITRQMESEQRKKSVNKERVKGLETRIVEGDKKREAAQRQAEGVFDTVYTHRYRDVDAKIRFECVSAFGSWITACPEVFFSGHYIRYLGWVLSDTAPTVRSEVIKQLSKLYRNQEDVGRMRAFTERFRQRLVEIATRDVEPNIRAAAVDLMGKVRETGLLEPDDIDNIGQLIFDAEPRVRKAVAGFFAENINDLFESVVEELGGDEGIIEAIGEEVEDDFEIPRRSWLKYKSLAEQLQGYDGAEESYDASRTLTAAGEESRIALAAQAICAGVAEVKEWEALAGYLLYDLSNVDPQSTDPEVVFKARCQLNEREEVLLLEVLHVAVKSRLTDAVTNEHDSKGRFAKARKEESREIQESTALHLAKLLPRLLKKFGASPSTTSAVLRLGQVLNLEIFQELRQNSTDYSSLLEDINKQFLTHVDPGVLSEASTTLLHARGFEDLEEVTETKTNELWDYLRGSVRALSDPSASVDRSTYADMSNTVRRITSLASIADCTEKFDAQPRASSKKQNIKPPPSLLTTLHDVLEGFSEQSDLDAEAKSDANEILTSSAQAILVYYMWLVRSLRNKLDSGAVSPPIPSFTRYSDTLLALMTNRSHTDAVRLAATNAYLDIHTLFATFRHIPAAENFQIQTIPPAINPLLTSIFTSTEKAFAKRAHKPLEPEPDDAPDVDSEPEDPSDLEDDEDEDATTQKQTALLLAEKNLCDLAGRLVRCIIARVLDCEGKEKGRVKERLLRNKMKLGPNLREVLAYLDPLKAKRKPATAAKKKAPVKKSKEVVEAEVESIEDEDQGDGRDQLEEGGEEDLRARELDTDGEEDGNESVGEDEGEGGKEPELEDDDIMGD